MTPESLSLPVINIRTIFFTILLLTGFAHAVPAQTIQQNPETETYNKSADSSVVDSLLTFAWDNKYPRDAQSFDNAMRALIMAEKLGYVYGIINASNYLGEQFNDWGNFPKALFYFQNALRESVKAKNTKKVVQSYLYIGQVYDNKEDFENALIWYRKAEAQAKENKDSLYLSFALGNEAIVMDRKGFPGRGYVLMQQSLAYLANGVGTRADSSNTYSNLALNQKRQGHYNQALSYLLQGKAMQNGAKDSLEILIWYDNMGSLFTAMKKFSEAKAMLDTALSITNTVNSDYINADIYDNISHYYGATGDYASALLWYKKSTAVKDTLQKQEQVRQFDALQIQYDVEGKEIQLARQSSKIEVQRKLNLTAIIAATLLLLLATLLWFSNRKRKKANLLLSDKNEEILLQKERLQEVNQVKDRLFSIISHDLKSPLESLRYYLKLLSNDRLSQEDLKDTAKELEHYLGHIRIMMDNLLYWASTQIKGWQLHPEETRPIDAVNEVLALISSDAMRKNISICNNLTEELQVYADPNLLKLALRNILSNAVKFTPEGGCIYVTGKKHSGDVRISVRDTGMGIPQEKLEKFKAGIPLASAPGTQQEKGTGLGILVSRQFIKKQGGDLEIESCPGNGTTVNIVLAAAPGAAWN